MFLLVGSAPYVPEWLNSHHWQDHVIVAMNKSWKMFEGYDRKPHYWSWTGMKWSAEWIPPAWDGMIRVKHQRNAYHHSHPMFLPRYIRAEAPILLSTLCWIVNAMVKNDYRTDIHIVGSDFDWPPKDNNTFYGRSVGFRILKPQKLDTALLHLRDQIARQNIDIYNVGEHEPTRLPWQRLTLP